MRREASDGANRAVSAVLVVLALGPAGLAGCADGYYAPYGAYATVDVEDVRATPADDGSTRIDAKVTLQLDTYEDDDEVALDTVEIDGFETDIEVDQVIVDDSDWPVAVAVGDPASRELQIVAHAGPLPVTGEGLCRQPLQFDVRVGLLVAGGRTEATGTGQVMLAEAGPRLGLARSVSEIGAAGAEVYDAGLEVTADGLGTQWMLARRSYPSTARLVSRSAGGAVVEEALYPGVVTMAPLADGGIVLVAPETGRATVALRRPGGVVVWQTVIASPLLVPESFLPVAVSGDRAVVALPGGADVTVPGLPPETTSGGTVVVELDLAGAPTSMSTTLFTGVQDLAASGDVIVVASSAGLVALRGGVQSWSSGQVTWAVDVAPSGDFVAAGQGWAARLDARNGAARITTPLASTWVAASIAVTADDELLLGSFGGTVAHVAADGTKRFEGQVVCEGTVAFGGTAGRVAFATLFGGLEGWGDVPDREVAETTLTLGEVLP